MDAEGHRQKEGSDGGAVCDLESGEVKMGKRRGRE